MIKEFFKPSSVEEALKLKKNQSNSFYLGGGTKLNNSGEDYKAEVFISLENMNLKGIVKAGEKVKIGALETLQQLIDSPEIPEFLKTAVLGENNRNIRNASTIGGVVASGKNYSTVLVALMAMNAEVETADDGVLAVDEYVKEGKNSLILAVLLSPVKSKMFQNNQRKTANSRPEIVVAASIVKSGDTVSDAVLVLGGVSDRPVRLNSVEKKLIDGSLTNADAVQDSVMDEIVKYTEKKENGTYLNYLSGVMAADSVGRCMR
jgi:putative selenate reductase FAD-binding subunit